MTKYLIEMNSILDNARNRIIDNGESYEIHHIIPKSLGGSDEEDNLIKLTLREHFIVHKLLYEHYNELKDDRRYSIGQAFWLMSTRKEINEFVYEELRLIQKECAKYHMSKTMSGMMPARDKYGNKYHVSTNDSRVLSGELFHHSKGKKLSKEEAMKKACPGEKNGKYSGITDDEIVEYGIELFEKINIIPSLNDLRIYVERVYNKNIPKYFSKFRFRNKTFYEILEEETSSKYNPYKRGLELKEYKQKIKDLINANN